MESYSVDRSGMVKAIVSLPFQIEKGWELAAGTRTPHLPVKINSFLVSGMGGSAIGGDLFRDIIEGLADFSVSVNRNYTLPRNVSGSTLHIAISYSGNTEETVSSLRDALSRRIETVVISSGGELERIAAEHNLPFMKIPGGLQPRAAVGYMLSSIIGLASKLGIFDFRTVIMDAIQEVRTRMGTLLPEVPVEKNEAKQLALWLGEKTPIIITTPGTYSLGERMKTQFNENSKRFAWQISLPEFNHNDWIPLFEDATVSNYRAIIFDSGDKNPYIRRRLGVVADLLAKRLEVRLMKLGQGNVLGRFIATMAVGDMASYYLSIMEGRDPSPVAPIEELKREIASRPL
ncbi:MAG: bifunctional phosphoglucose/phosphomannose isomerase [Candidatus Thermoplasmatota archaeon]|nr:bifunctional phosphoglucose/phosphomannose isomerase [Candidatus Thermoplasmatota archaeon]